MGDYLPLCKKLFHIYFYHKYISGPGNAGYILLVCKVRVGGFPVHNSSVVGIITCLTTAARTQNIIHIVMKDLAICDTKRE